MWKLIRPDAFNVFEDPRVSRSLPRYIGIVRGRKLAKFLISRSIGVDFDYTSSDEELWRIHSKRLEEYPKIEYEFDEGLSKLEEVERGRSFLDLKIELARRMMKSCHFCVRRCGVDRLEGQKGYCRCGTELNVSSFFAHMGEEPELVPSGTVFTCGCSMRCILCQNWEISQWKESGTTYSPREMVRVVTSLKNNGCRNLNMVGGDPTPYCWQWLQVMRGLDVNIATVWNSNSYYSQETAELLAGFVDLYLLDFKYGSNKHAEEISDAPMYWEAATRNHLMAKRQGELIIRVLVLPGHNDCCTRPILRWIAENLGVDTRVNLMFQYRPEWRAYERPELRRRLSKEEMEEALQIAKDSGLRNLVD
ncbi:radical SAM protein [Candidatus Bathyarchaeota archaeon]|nr:radical SAM protein [Candidatus Bathyarchaeota archaeon]MBS7631350.1 radical SAM protein [Candidatus Bathyarchaeota archaeon]